MSDQTTTAPVTLLPIEGKTNPKPGWKTSEFYFKIAALILSGLFATDVIPTSSAWMKFAMIAAFVLTSLGYTVSRTLIKTAAMLALLVLATHTTACAWFRGESKAVAGDVVDCTTSAASSQIKEYGPLVDSMLTYATDGGGKINADAVKSASKGFALEVGGCVLADSIARALTPKPTDPNAPKSSPLEADPGSLRDAIGAIYPGKHFKTASGML